MNGIWQLSSVDESHVFAFRIHDLFGFVSPPAIRLWPNATQDKMIAIIKGEWRPSTCAHKRSRLTLWNYRSHLRSPSLPLRRSATNAMRAYAYASSNWKLNEFMAQITSEIPVWPLHVHAQGGHAHTQTILVISLSPLLLILSLLRAVFDTIHATERSSNTELSYW